MPANNPSSQSDRILLRHSVDFTYLEVHHQCEATFPVAANASSEEMLSAVQRLQHIIEVMMQTAGNNRSIPIPPESEKEISPHAETSFTANASDVTEPAAKPAASTRFAPTTLAAFYKAAAEYGYKAAEIPSVLHLESMSGFTDFVGALQQLKVLALQRAEKSEAAPSANHGFAEEISPYTQQPESSNAELDVLAEIDEPDFGSMSSPELDESFAPDPDAEAADAQHSELTEQTMKTLAKRRLQQMRTIANSGSVASPDQRQALLNLVIDRLGKEKAQNMVMAIWHPAKGEKLNAARTRALIEWSKEDDLFEDVVEHLLMIPEE